MFYLTFQIKLTLLSWYSEFPPSIMMSPFSSNGTYIQSKEKKSNVKHTIFTNNCIQQSEVLSSVPHGNTLITNSCLHQISFIPKVLKMHYKLADVMNYTNYTCIKIICPLCFSVTLFCLLDRM